MTDRRATHMPPDLDPAYAAFRPVRRESPTEGMRRIERDLRSDDFEYQERPRTQPNRLGSNAGRSLEGYNASIGAQGPLSAGLIGAGEPETGKPQMVGGRVQAGPLSYQYTQPTFKGAPAGQQVGVSVPFDADSYFGVTAQQTPGQGRTYGANVGGDGWNVSGGYNPTSKSVNANVGYQANFADGGRVPHMGWGGFFDHPRQMQPDMAQQQAMAQQAMAQQAAMEKYQAEALSRQSEIDRQDVMPQPVTPPIEQPVAPPIDRQLVPPIEPPIERQLVPPDIEPPQPVTPLRPDRDPIIEWPRPPIEPIAPPIEQPVAPPIDQPVPPQPVAPSIERQLVAPHIDLQPIEPPIYRYRRPLEPQYVAQPSYGAQGSGSNGLFGRDRRYFGLSQPSPIMQAFEPQQAQSQPQQPQRQPTASTPLTWGEDNDGTLTRDYALLLNAISAQSDTYPDDYGAKAGYQASFAKGGPVDIPDQVANVASDIAAIARKDGMDLRHLAYLVRVASGMFIPPERAIEYAKQIMNNDVVGLMRRFQKYRASARTLARLNEMVGGKHKFLGTDNMGEIMMRTKGDDALQQTKQAVESALDSNVIKSRPAMAKALNNIKKRI